MSRLKEMALYNNLEESQITRIQDGAVYFREYSIACKRTQ